DLAAPAAPAEGAGIGSENEPTRAPGEVVEAVVAAPVTEDTREVECVPADPALEPRGGGAFLAPGTERGGSSGRLPVPRHTLARLVAQYASAQGLPWPPDLARTSGPAGAPRPTGPGCTPGPDGGPPEAGGPDPEAAPP